MNWRNSVRKPYLVMISLFCLLQTQEFKSFTHRIYNSNCPKNPQKKKFNNQNPKNRINRLNKKKGKKINLFINIPWKEEVLRSFSIHFLSMMLSSTARTWNCDSPAIPIALLHPKKASKKKYEDEEKREWEVNAHGLEIVFVGLYLSLTGYNESMIPETSSRIMRVFIDLWLTVWGSVQGSFE